MNDEMDITKLLRDYVRALSVHECADVTERKIRKGRLLEISVSGTDARRVIGAGGTTFRAMTHVLEFCREAKDNQIILLPVKIDNRYNPPVKSFKANFNWNPDKLVFPMYLRFLEELGSASSGWSMIPPTNVADFNPEFPKLDEKLATSLNLLINVLAMTEGGNVVSGHDH